MPDQTWLVLTNLNAEISNDLAGASQSIQANRTRDPDKWAAVYQLVADRPCRSVT